jgi:hypothetical protein
VFTPRAKAPHRDDVFIAARIPVTGSFELPVTGSFEFVPGPLLADLTRPRLRGPLVEQLVEVTLW